MERRERGSAVSEGLTLRNGNRAISPNPSRYAQEGRQSRIRIFHSMLVILIAAITLYPIVPFSHGLQEYLPRTALKVIGEEGCHDPNPRSLQSVACTCASGSYKINFDRSKPDSSHQIHLDIANGFVVATLGRSHAKVFYRDEDLNKVDLKLLTHEELTILEGVNGAGLELETDLSFEMISHQSYNPSYLILRKVSDIKKTINVSLVSTFGNPNIISKLKYYEGNHFVCQDTSHSSLMTTPPSVCTHPLKSDLKSISSRSDDIVTLDANSFIIQDIHLNPRGPGAKAHLNRWRLSRFSLRLTKYLIRVKVKCGSKSSGNIPRPKPVTKPSVINTISEPSTSKTSQTSRLVPAPVSIRAVSHSPVTRATTVSKPEDPFGKCGQVHITEADREAYNMAIAAHTSPSQPPLPTTHAPETSATSSNGKISAGRHVAPNEAHDANGEANELLGKIIGGTAALPGAWPWQVSIRSNGKHDCGGALLNNYWILSAQHCFVRPNRKVLTLKSGNTNNDDNNQDEAKSFYSRYTVHMGTVLKSKPFEHEEIRRFDEVIPFPNYATARKHDNDIILLKMDKPIKFTKYMAPICLSREMQLSTSALCMVTGFGETQGLGKDDILNELPLFIVDYEICNSKDWLNKRLTPNMFCAGGRGNKDSCQGDSGGPFMCVNDSTSVWSLVGVVSWGINCGMIRRPGVYAKVANYVDWIENHIY